MRTRSKIAHGGCEVSPVFFLFLLALPFLLLMAAVIGLVVFLVTLPFRILGFAFHVLGAATLLLLPVLPLALLAFAGVWVIKRLAGKPVVA